MFLVLLFIVGLLVILVLSFYLSLRLAVPDLSSLIYRKVVTTNKIYSVRVIKERERGRPCSCIGGSTRRCDASGIRWAYSMMPDLSQPYWDELILSIKSDLRAQVTIQIVRCVLNERSLNE